jgi:DnaJ-domain-containing protein 1
VRETDRHVNDVATLQRRADEGARAELVRFLTELAALDTRGVSRAEREVLVELSAALGVSPSVIAATEEEKGGLDRRACRILSVPPTADEAEVRRSFRVLAQQLHPDSGAGLDTGRREAMNDAFTRVRDAYELVLDQLRRREEIKGADLSSSITPKR